MPRVTPRSSSSTATAKRPASKRNTYGPLAAAWIEANVVHGEGDSFGEPFKLTDDQQQFLDRLLVHDAKGTLIVQRALLGRAKGWGKTEFIAAVVLLFLVGPFAPVAPNIPIAAASFEQADLLFGTARIMVTEGPLAPYIEAYDTELLLKDGLGRAFRVAAAAGTNDGGRPTLFAADELHEWVGSKRRVFLVITNSIAKRKNGLVIAISTAGSPDSELLREMYDYGRGVEAGVLPRDPAFLFDWKEADLSLDPSDGPEVRAEMARQANPHVDQFGTMPFVERRWHEIAEHEWRRYFANQWWEAPLDSWLPIDAFENCRELGCQVDQGLDFVACVDMALKHDTCAVVLAQVGSTVTNLDAKVFVPTPDKPIDIAAVEGYLRRLNATGHLLEVGYDPAYFERSAQALSDDGLVMVEFPQSPQRMVPACGHAYELIVGGKVRHHFDEVATAQVVDAVPRETDNGWRISKGKSKRKIDTAVAMVMAIDRASKVEPAHLFVY